MADLTKRNNAARHRDQDRKHRLLKDQLDGAIARVAAAEESLRALQHAGAQPQIIQDAEQRLERAEATQRQFSTQLSQHEQRLDALETWRTQHQADYDQAKEEIRHLRVTNNVFANAFAEIRDQTTTPWWLVLAMVGVGTLVWFFLISVVSTVFEGELTFWQTAAIAFALAGVTAAAALSVFGRGKRSAVSAAAAATSVAAGTPTPASATPASNEPPTAVTPVTGGQSPALAPVRGNATAAAAAQVNS